MNVEAGHLIHRLLCHDVYRQIGERLDRIGERFVRRVREENRSRLEARRGEQPPCDETTLGDEDSARAEQFRVGDVAIVDETRVRERGDGDDHRVSLRDGVQPSGSVRTSNGTFSCGGMLALNFYFGTKHR